MLESTAVPSSLYTSTNALCPLHHLDRMLLFLVQSSLHEPYAQVIKAKYTYGLAKQAHVNSDAC